MFYDYIKFTNRSITPTNKNNKTRIRFACKHVGCLFDLLFVKPAKNGESGDFVIKKFVNYSQVCPKLWVQQPHQQQESKAHYISSKLHGKDWRDVKKKTGRKQHWKMWNWLCPLQQTEFRSSRILLLVTKRWRRVQPAEELVWVISHDTHDGSWCGRSVIEKGQ